MTVLPVIERELRAEARNSYHHWLRLTSATAVLIYFYVRLVPGRRAWNVLVWFSMVQLGLGAISAFYLHTLLAQRRFLSKPST